MAAVASAFFKKLDSVLRKIAVFPTVVNALLSALEIRRKREERLFGRDRMRRVEILVSVYRS